MIYLERYQFTKISKAERTALQEVKEAKQDQALGTRTTILHLKCWRMCSGINEKRKARQAHKGTLYSTYLYI